MFSLFSVVFNKIIIGVTSVALSVTGFFNGAKNNQPVQISIPQQVAKTEIVATIPNNRNVIQPKPTQLTKSASALKPTRQSVVAQNQLLNSDPKPLPELPKLPIKEDILGEDILPKFNERCQNFLQESEKILIDNDNQIDSLKNEINYIDNLIATENRYFLPAYETAIEMFKEIKSRYDNQLTKNVILNSSLRSNIVNIQAKEFPCELGNELLSNFFTGNSDNQETINQINNELKGLVDIRLDQISRPLLNNQPSNQLSSSDDDEKLNAQLEKINNLERQINELETTARNRENEIRDTLRSRDATESDIIREIVGQTGSLQRQITDLTIQLDTEMGIYDTMKYGLPRRISPRTPIQIPDSNYIECTSKYVGDTDYYGTESGKLTTKCY